MVDPTVEILYRSNYPKVVSRASFGPTVDHGLQSTEKFNVFLKFKLRCFCSDLLAALRVEKNLLDLGDGGEKMVVNDFKLFFLISLCNS